MLPSSTSRSTEEHNDLPLLSCFRSSISNSLIHSSTFRVTTPGTTIIVPETVRVVLPLHHAVDIEGVYEGEEEVAVLFVPGPPDLSHTVLTEVYLRTYRRQRALAMISYKGKERGNWVYESEHTVR